ncbi:MAG: aldo/keto reductase [Atopobiaceae bacterium]|nr:aldo/keto reductase [Atopobiaceae bacterium]
MTVENPKKLGFGLMRLPRRVVGNDIKQMSQMVDLFMEAGCTYFDTAHVYLGSEEAARKALVERYPRESFTLATKLYAPTAPTRHAAQKQFATSLKRTGASYIDYYLLHSLMGNNVHPLYELQVLHEGLPAAHQYPRRVCCHEQPPARRCP